MKIADYISKYIQKYPFLYKDVDYEKSKLKVLNQIFFTIGNGLEMADTENPKEGGYFVKPKYKKDRETDEWVRIKDKPYGKEKYKPLPNDYFESVIYTVYADGYEIKTTHLKGEYGNNDRVYFRYNKKFDDKFNGLTLLKAENFDPFYPYPFCSIFPEGFDDNIFLQDDWLQELIFLCKRTLEYFNDENQYKFDSYYPNEYEIKRDVNYFKERFDKEGLKGVIDLRKLWGYEEKETLPDYEEVRIIKEKKWKKFRDQQLESLTKFLDKHTI